MASNAQAKFDETLARLDSVLDGQVRRVEVLEAAQNAEREAARAQRMRDNAEARRQIQATYADAFAAFGNEPPAPIDDEAPVAYRRRLFNRLARKLAPDHELSQIRADDLGGQSIVFDKFEQQLIGAAKAEGLRPSLENLPPGGEMISRIRVDRDTGEKSIHWHGRTVREISSVDVKSEVKIEGSKSSVKRDSVMASSGRRMSGRCMGGRCMGGGCMGERCMDGGCMGGRCMD